MKRVNITKWRKGIVLRNDAYVKTLNEGAYWVMPWDTVLSYDMAQPFSAPCNLDIMLRDEVFRDAVILVDVKQNEIVLRFENGLLADVLLPGRHLFWKGLVNYSFTAVRLDDIYIDAAIDRSLLAHKLLLPYTRSFTVEPNEKAVLYLDGKYEKVLEAGTYFFWKNSQTIHLSRIDTRTMQMEVSGQELLSRDKAALRINFHVQYRISDILKAIVANKDFEKQLYVLMQLVLREFTGALTLDELLEKKEQAAVYITEAVAERAAQLGVVILSCGIRDVILPGDMKEIMNQVLIAEKKAQANTIMRREETASARSLLNTAKLMEDNNMLYRLKEMEYVERIAEKISSISLSGGTQLADQLKQLFVPVKH